MPISTISLHRTAVEGMSRKYDDLAKLQNQISSGRRITSLADDPTGAARVNELRREVARYEQFGANSDYAQGRMELEDQTLTNFVDVLQGTREEAVRAITGTMNDADRNNMAYSFELAAKQLAGVMNTKSADGEYIFGGYMTNAEPFDATGAYQGDTNQRSVRINETITVPLGHHGQGLFDDGTDSMITILNDFASALRNGTQDASILSKIDTVMDQALNANAETGARMRMIENQRQVSGDYELYLQQQLADVQDVDIVKSLTNLNQEMTAIQALQQTYGKTSSLSLFNYI